MFIPSSSLRFLGVHPGRIAIEIIGGGCATSRLMHLKFVETESTFAYFRSTREYLERYGKPVGRLVLSVTRLFHKPSNCRVSLLGWCHDKPARS
jgi:hypothetical protein